MKMDVFDDEERILRIYVLEGKIMWSTFNEIQNVKCPMDITILDINDINNHLSMPSDVAYYHTCAYPVDRCNQERERQEY